MGILLGSELKCLIRNQGVLSSSTGTAVFYRYLIRKYRQGVEHDRRADITGYDLKGNLQSQYLLVGYDAPLVYIFVLVYEQITGKSSCDFESQPSTG